jgi:hypothetical protein
LTFGYNSESDVLPKSERERERERERGTIAYNCVKWVTKSENDRLDWSDSAMEKASEIPSRFEVLS